MNLAMRVTHSFIFVNYIVSFSQEGKCSNNICMLLSRVQQASLSNCQHTTALDTLCAPQPGKDVLLSPFTIFLISIPSPPSSSFFSMIQPLHLLGTLHYSFSFLPHPIQFCHLYFKYKSLSIFSAVIFTHVIVPHCLFSWRFSELDPMPPVLSPAFSSHRDFSNL